MNHQQVGDPDKLGHALVELAASDQPPLRFAAGEDAIAVTELVLGNRRGDLEAWRTLSASLGL
jgi:hypothetical protein